MSTNPVKSVGRTVAFALTSLALVACGDESTQPTPLVGATIDVTIAGVTRQWRAPAAGFWVYSPGPTPEVRAMDLTIARGAPADSLGGFEFSGGLRPNSESPEVGTFSLTSFGSGPNTYFVATGLPWAQVSGTIPLDTGLAPRFSIDSVRGEFAYGRFQMQLRQPTPPRAMVSIRGSFIALRSASFESLPRW